MLWFVLFWVLLIAPVFLAWSYLSTIWFACVIVTMAVGFFLLHPKLTDFFRSKIPPPPEGCVWPIPTPAWFSAFTGWQTDGAPLAVVLVLLHWAWQYGSTYRFAVSLVVGCLVSYVTYGLVVYHFVLKARPTSRADARKGVTVLGVLGGGVAMLFSVLVPAGLIGGVLITLLLWLGVIPNLASG
jgi:hypothetical protein